MAIPAAIPAAVIAAAAWCARGALASVPTSVLEDIANGAQPTDYVRNAVIGCLVGEVGGWVWRVTPQWAKRQAIGWVVWFVVILPVADVIKPYSRRRL